MASLACRSATRMSSRYVVGSHRAMVPPSSIRSYAQASTTSASSSAATKPPIALFGIDGTYASALYTAAAKTSSLDSTARALSSLAEIFRKDGKLPSILAAPTLSAADKSQIVTELLKHTGGGVGTTPSTGNNKNETVKNFLKALADNNRLGILPAVCEKFGSLVSVHRGEVELLVTSAAPLDQKTLSRLESAISKSDLVGPGKKLRVNNKVNPEILGGLIVEIGDRTIDVSVSSKLAKMNKLLMDTI